MSSMTWWEVEEMNSYIDRVEEGLNEWKFSNPKMRLEQQKITKLAEKIENALPAARQVDKKDFLEHLAARVAELQEYLTERLKREVTKNVSPRNLLS